MWTQEITAVVRTTLPFCNMKEPDSPEVDPLEFFWPSTTVRAAIEATTTATAPSATASHRPKYN